MKKTISLFLSLIMIICAFQAYGVSALAADNIKVSVPVQLNYDYANEVLTLVNKERASAGGSSLTMDKSLYEAAMKRAAELVVYFSHTRPDGTDCYTASSKMSGENIAAGFSTPEYVMEGWMNSAGHKSNILNKSFKSVGIGCARYGSTYFWVQCFGRDSAQSTSKSGKTDITADITVAPENFELYYNSINDFDSYYVNNPYIITIVGLNKGWEGRCYTIKNELFELKSSDERVFTVDSDGTIHPVHDGKATLIATFTPNPDYVLTTEISVKCGFDDYIDGTLKGGADNADGTGEADAEISKPTPPKATSIKKLKKGSRRFKATWKKVSGVAGYQLQYSVKKSMKGAKTLNVKGTAKTVKGLKKGKRYYVRVRTCKMRNGIKFYSSWSKIKAVKTK